VKVRVSAGRTVILALCSVSLAACGNGLPGGGKQLNAQALQASAGDPQTRAFYQARQWQAAWDGKSEKALQKIIGGALAHGLKPSLFLDGPLPGDPEAREAALTSAALRYASALARGYADPAKINEIYTIPRPNPDVAKGLAAALKAGELEQWFSSLPPQTAEYRALSQAHQQAFGQAAQVKPTPVPGGKAIEPGKRDKRLPAIATSLAINGYLPSGRGDLGVPDSNSGILLDAIKRLQADHGMKPDGIIGEDTLAALNAGPAGRARQLAVAMERLRWLERETPETRIDVNTAAAFLDYWRDGKHVDRRNVVVGEPGWETPQLGSPLFQLVANPLWRVPDSILEDELAGKSGAYLARNGFEHREGRLVQRSGPKNSLGQVKFDMKNKESIYLHDTPAKALFTTAERHRSHGCVRVHNALQFAGLLASQDEVIDPFKKGFASKDETYVKLKSEIPVRLLYHTAFWDGSRVQFRPDVYGWDDNVAAAIGLLRGPARTARKHAAGDVGP
jgi:murein L,D-transpeptidase YcbB/YkuD